MNSRRALGLPAWDQLSDAQLLELLPDDTRATLIAMGLLAEDFSADDLRQVIPRMKPELQDQGFNAAQAATIILDGVRSGAWRILVGEEAKMLDEQVRANPEAPFNYENYAEMYGPLIAQAEAEAWEHRSRNRSGSNARHLWRVAGRRAGAVAHYRAVFKPRRKN